MVKRKTFTNLVQYKQQAVFLCAVMLAAVVGGASTALVRAAIPSADGTVTACVDKTGGAVRIVDSENSVNCSNSLEDTVSLASGAARPISFVALNDDGTLNSSYSSGVTSMQLVQVPDSDPATYSVCLVLPFTPKFAYSHVGWANVPVARGNPADTSKVDDKCGASYNAAIVNTIEPYSSMQSAVFLN